MPLLMIIRGLPGVGKTTLAKSLRGIKHLEADIELRGQAWSPQACALAHMTARAKMINLLLIGYDVVVANTFTRWGEVISYTAEAPRGTSVAIIDLYDGGLSDEQLHARTRSGISLEKLQTMRARYERGTVYP